MRKFLIACVVALAAHAASAADCEGFRWPVAAELKLFASPAAAAVAGRDEATAAELQTGRLYRLALAEQESVHLPVAPSKKMLTDGAYAGVVRLNLAAAGRYRVALDEHLWVDVVHGGTLLESADFSGSEDCDGPRKIVEYAIPAPGEYLVQVSAAGQPAVRVAITAVP